jgi:hypothetical protein
MGDHDGLESVITIGWNAHKTSETDVSELFSGMHESFTYALEILNSVSVLSDVLQAIKL